MLTLTDTKNGLRQGKKLLISHFMSEILFVMSLSQKYSIVKSAYILLPFESAYILLPFDGLCMNFLILDMLSTVQNSFTRDALHGRHS